MKETKSYGKSPVKVPGIIGGLGPDTTAKIYLALATFQEFEVYPDILISNVSFPKVLEEEIGVRGKDCELILPYLLKSIRCLEGAGSDFIVLPCNTLHSLLQELRKNTQLEILDLVGEVSNYVSGKYDVVGIIGTSKTKEEKLYDRKLKSVKLIYPDDSEQKRVSNIIIRIIRCQADKKDKEFLEGLISDMVMKGAEKIIFACTDLGNLIIDNVSVIDSTKILINSIISKMDCEKECFKNKGGIK